MNASKKRKMVAVGLGFMSLAAIAVLSIYAAPSFAEGQTRVELCLSPGPHQVTIEVAEPAVNALLAQGARLGPCEEINVCPFEPVMITLTSADPVRLLVQIVSAGQDVNFQADDPPGVYWALTDLEGTAVIGPYGADDHFHLTWEPINFSEPGTYYMVFEHELASTVYPEIKVNLACDYEAPQP